MELYDRLYDNQYLIMVEGDIIEKLKPLLRDIGNNLLEILNGKGYNSDNIYCSILNFSCDYYKKNPKMFQKDRYIWEMRLDTKIRDFEDFIRYVEHINKIFNKKIYGIFDI